MATGNQQRSIYSASPESRKFQMINCKIDCIFLQITVIVILCDTTNIDISHFLVKSEGRFYKNILSKCKRFRVTD
jgi:hypothetical protein